MAVIGSIKVDTAGLRKARGAFFTPPDVARYVANWAIRDEADTVLEPSCGEAAFLLASADRQRDLGGPGGRRRAGSLSGIELHEPSAVAAERIMRTRGVTAHVQTADFFDVPASPEFDVVVGNPPYVRYQNFGGKPRQAAKEAALRAGVTLSNLASSWAAFTIHASLFLKPGGRLGLVLPAELLTVNYAGGVRKYLMERFARVRLVLFTERVFPGVLEEVVLLLAEGTGPTDHCELLQLQSAADLSAIEPGVLSKWSPSDLSAKWSAALVPGKAASIYANLTNTREIGILNDWGDTTLGMVTGANKYFALTPSDVQRLKISEDDVIPLIPPGSRHLRGLSFTTRQRNALGELGRPTFLFRPVGELDHRAKAYVKTGEDMGVNLGYKCRIRSPWWRVPYLEPADLLLTYMNADTPRLTTNAANAHHLNSVHGIYLRTAVRQLGKRLLPLASLNSVTLLGAETVGRAYGGGMLKIEPREADILPVPSAKTVISAADELSAARDKVGDYLRTGRLLEAVRVVDQILLVNTLGLAVGDVAELEAAHAHLAARRVARGLKVRQVRG